MKKIGAYLMSFILSASVLAGCAVNTGNTASTGTSSTKVVKDLPITGIGATVSTTVKSNKKLTIACIIKNTTNPYMVKLGEGVKKAGKDMGIDVIVLSPATQDSVEGQVQNMEDMIEKGANGIVIAPVDSNGIMPGVKKAEDAKIPVATIGTPAATQTFLRTGVDYTETGYLVAKKIAEKIGGKGNVIILEGPPGAQNAQERLAGIKKGLSEYKDIKIVASQTADFLRTEGMSVTENLLQAHPDVNAIIAANDESALGAVQALKAAGKKNVAVGGFDGNMDCAQAIKDGDITVSYNTDPFGSGYLAAVYEVLYLTEGKKPPQYFVPFPSSDNDPLITSDNIDEYINNIAWWK